MSLSNELQIGKAAEHLVCANLILQGCNAFLADQGLPYDVVVDTAQGLKRIQVKSSMSPARFPGAKEASYRFGTRRAKYNTRKVSVSEMDFYAFVALDILQIAYVPIHLMCGSDKVSVLQCIEFRSRHYSHVSHNAPRTMRFFEDYARFPLAQAEYTGFQSVVKSEHVNNLSLWNLNGEEIA